MEKFLFIGVEDIRNEKVGRVGVCVVFILFIIGVQIIWMYKIYGKLFERVMSLKLVFSFIYNNYFLIELVFVSWLLYFIQCLMYMYIKFEVVYVYFGMILIFCLQVKVLKSIF